MTSRPQVGEIRTYVAFGNVRRVVRITETSDDIKNGRAGFDAIEIESGECAWGYDDQLVD